MRKILLVAVLLLCAAPAFGQCENSTLTFQTESLPLFFTHQHFDLQIEAVGGVPPYTFTVSTDPAFDPLPPGFRLRSDGQLKGTPRGPGNSTVGILLTDAEGCDITQAFNVQIDPP